ncbi:energy transducer TonB [Actibacterium sp. XHP0104]|uniref:energy transducer TonB n=1 Tax=Actibacterium sp. XHP0104 TaxID=2984335 RepID=UPI0021E7F609|nr:energy transducer TonB [Actibacterium sp. XHP0104]MCV2881496.1 TonB family protein [Actibacterium sp. XHP0104]
MRRLAEAALFLPLAAGLHLAAFGIASDGGSGPTGGGAGQGGQAEVTLAAIPPDLARRVETWDRPPEAETTAPDLPRDAVTEAAPALPDTHTAPEPAAQPLALKRPEPPRPPAKAAALPKKPQPPVAAQKARGAGKAPIAGQAEGQDAAQQQALTASWGARIQSRVARAHRYPAALRRQGHEGTAVVRMVIAADGRLISAALRRSSGHAELDEAALQSVRRAGRFPAAPDDLRADRATFDVPLKFEIR